MRRAAHRDKSEKPIVEALRAVGAHVFLLSGKGVPDLLCFYRGTWTPLEVKTPKADRCNVKATLTPAQQAAMRTAPYVVVETVEQALRAVGCV